jgi:YD repeat-containing protein
MKTLLTRAGVLLLISFALSCTEYESSTCRISKFYWEGEWHKAQYNSSGRLQGLVAANSKVVFYYDALSRLTSAAIYMGDPDPYYKYEFIHGPHGIIQADEYHPSAWGTEHNRLIYHYSSPTSVDYIIMQDFGHTEEIGFQIRYDFSYTEGGNVKHVDGTSTVIHTDYFALKYDDRKNPFRILAAAVGNPVFFPIGTHANFPMSSVNNTYDISLLNRFSKNNPVFAQYEVPGVDPTDQFFTYTYDGNLANTLKWDEVSYGVTKSEKFAFEFECKPFKAEE